MHLPTTTEIIISLKAEKAKKHYSIPKIHRMCEERGLYVCVNTLRNIFGKGSEHNSFSYEHTLRPIANVLLPQEDKPPADVNAKQLEIMQAQLELLTAQLQKERAEHQRSIQYFADQVNALRKNIAEKEELMKEVLGSIGEQK